MASVLERPWHIHRKCARRTSVCYKVSRVPQSNLSDLIYRLETEVQRNEMTAQDQGQVIKDNHPNTGLATQKYCFCRSAPPGTNVLLGLAGGSTGLYSPGKQCQNDQRQTGCHPRAGKEVKSHSASFKPRQPPCSVAV